MANMPEIAVGELLSAEDMLMLRHVSNRHEETIENNTAVLESGSMGLSLNHEGDISDVKIKETDHA